MSDVKVSKEEVERWLKEKGIYDLEEDNCPDSMKQIEDVQDKARG